MIAADAAACRPQQLIREQIVRKRAATCQISHGKQTVGESIDASKYMSDIAAAVVLSGTAAAAAVLN